MHVTSSEKTKRIAKNTLLLYIRTFFTMSISLYTSRVILEALGMDDYGVYNVVGGIVGLLGIMSAPLINAVTRFLTYYMGLEDISNLNKVFSTSVIIQIALSCAVVFICETIGLWFLNHQLNIPSGSLNAANWVFQMSIISSVFGLVIIPYNAAIVAHEKMGIYAYFSIIEVVIKLIFVIVLTNIPSCRLVFYAFFLLCLSITMQLINFIYCKRHFLECSIKWELDKTIFKEISAFAGWNFFGNAANVMNSQGINILLNLFFGVVVNAARAIVSQVENAIKQFVSNFLIAINPQITKSFAQRDYEFIKKLACTSSKFSFYLFMLFGLPVWLESDIILKLWLNTVPEYTGIFLRLSMVVTAIILIGDSSYTIMMATGKIRNYQIIAVCLGIIVLPLSWLCYKFGLPAYTCYILLIINYILVIVVRLYLLQLYIKSFLYWFLVNCVIPISKVLALTMLLTLFVTNYFHASLGRVFITVACTTSFGITTIYFFGMSIVERSKLRTIISSKISHIKGLTQYRNK